MREKLPDRRDSWTQKARIADAHGVFQTFYLTCGEYEDGRLGEIWIEAHKEGTFARGILQALARMVSTALQCGEPVSEVVKTLRHLNFPPQGRIEAEYTTVTHCTSVADWIAQEIEIHYLNKPLVTASVMPHDEPDVEGGANIEDGAEIDSSSPVADNPVPEEVPPPWGLPPERRAGSYTPEVDPASTEAERKRKDE